MVQYQDFILFLIKIMSALARQLKYIMQLLTRLLLDGLNALVRIGFPEFNIYTYANKFGTLFQLLGAIWDLLILVFTLVLRFVLRAWRWVRNSLVLLAFIIAGFFL